MIDHHRLPPELFRRVAAAKGDAEATGFLARTRLSRNLLLLGYIVESLVSREREVDQAVAAISAMQESDPDIIEHILIYPWVSTWMAVTARGRTPIQEADYICAIAAAAAHRCAPWDVEPDWIRRSPFLPTVGLTGERQFEIVQPVRRIVVEFGDRELTMLVDDVDPHRHCLGAAVAARMDESQWQAWHSGFMDAWDVLARNAPDRCAELAAGLTSIVPLDDSQPVGTSVTFADAFGGFGGTMPRDAAQFAVTMVHELQHSKLNAIMSLVDLHDQNHQTLFEVPWRADRRPLGGVIHGVYAFAAVAETWHALGAEPRIRQHATDECRRIKGQVLPVIERIMQCGGLTAAGAELVAEVQRTLAALPG